ncbi:toll/interleukin-1 receptor domain-containing protein [Nocardia vinacea]
MCAKAAETPALHEGARESFAYDAFISYAHDDRPVAAGIQMGLHRIGRRVGRLHALRVFRDATDLTASPYLWGKVLEAMDRARYLIVVLSSHAVASGWVNREVAHWLERRGSDRLLFVVADGRVAWDKPPAGSTRTGPMSHCRFSASQGHYRDLGTDSSAPLANPNPPAPEHNWRKHSPIGPGRKPNLKIMANRPRYGQTFRDLATSSETLQVL